MDENRRDDMLFLRKGARITLFFSVSLSSTALMKFAVSKGKLIGEKRLFLDGSGGFEFFEGVGAVDLGLFTPAFRQVIDLQEAVARL